MAKLLINSDRKVLASQRGKIYKAPSPSLLKNLLDNTKSAYHLFYKYTGTSVNDLIQYSDTENVTTMSETFYSCQNLQSIPQLDTRNVTYMRNMFSGCSKLQTIPQLNTSNVTDMYGMFSNCEKLQSIPQLDTSKVTTMLGMFIYCSKLQTIPPLNTSKVTDMDNMFKSCYNLQTIPQIDTSNVKYMSGMFSECTALQTIQQLDTSKVTSMDSMFSYCPKLQTIDLTHMKITSTNRSYRMCYDCRSLTKFIIRNMDTIPALSSDAFTNCYHFTGKTNSTYNPNGLKDGRIYVPDNMVASLKSATNWSKYANIIVPLSTLKEE